MAVAEAIGLILLAWILGAALFLGLGLLVLPHVQDGADGVFRALWAGFAAMLAFLQVWHWAWPVGGAALAVLGGLAAAGLVRSRRRWRGFRVGGRGGLWTCGLVLAVLVLIANRSLGPPLGNDSGGYHLGSVRWAAEHPLVPGLGNLDARLGFGSSHFLYVALLDVGPLEWRSHHVASGLLLALLFAQLLTQAARVGASARASDMAAALLIPAALAQALGPGVSSPSPDLAVFVLGVVLGLGLLALCEERERPALDLVALAAALVTVKLSALGLAAGAVAVALGVARGAHRGRLLRAAALGAAFLVPWMASNVVLTGYPAYPLRALAMPVPWRLADADVARLQDWIRSWARAPGLRPEQVLGGSAWIGPWARALLGNRVWVQVPLALLAAGAILLATSRRAVALLPALAAPLAGVAYWLATAPDVRFLGASLWLLAVFTVAIAAGAAGWPPAPHAVAGLGALLALGGIAGAARRGDLFLRPDPIAGFHATPLAPVTPHRTRSGLVVLTPPAAQGCFYAPLPCTPDPPEDLRLRRPGDLRSGFVRGR